jgi:hypothetical protein
MSTGVEGPVCVFSDFVSLAFSSCTVSVLFAVSFGELLSEVLSVEVAVSSFS